MHPYRRHKGHQILNIFVSNALLKIGLGEGFEKPLLRPRGYQKALRPKCRTVPLLPVQRSREPQSWGIISPPHSSPPARTRVAPLFPTEVTAHRSWVQARRLNGAGSSSRVGSLLLFQLSLLLPSFHAGDLLPCRHLFQAST